MTTSTSMMGGLVRRKEDPALIRGRGLYTDDVKLPGQLTAAFVRSPFAKARITSIDADEARAMPGVHAVYTIDDVRYLGPLLAQVHEKERKSNARSKPIDGMLMFKVLILQTLYNLADKQVEYQI